MKTRLLTVIITALAICGIASAQNYNIRIGKNTNLRDGASLEANIIETAQAGATLHVIGSLGKWFKISRAGGDVWMANWVTYTRVEGGGQAAAPAQNIDNCCFVDRQCDTDQDWTDGYWAFQNGQCQAPVQAQQPGQPASSSPATGFQTPTVVDNCCFVDRQCSSDQEWTAGYFAYQQGQCGGPGGGQGASGPPSWSGSTARRWTSYMTQGVAELLANPSSDPFNNCCMMHHGTCHSAQDWERGYREYRNGQCARPMPLGRLPEIVGGPKFHKLVNDALGLMRQHAPEWVYYMSLSGALKLEELIDGAGGFYNQSWSIGHGWTSREVNDPNWQPDMNYLAGYAGGITHEACHSIKQRTYTQTAGYLNEAPCVEAQLAVIKAVHPGSKDIGWLTNLVRNIESANWWS